jgi:hypothetical protein
MGNRATTGVDCVAMLALELPELTCLVLDGEVQGVAVAATAALAVVDLDALVGAGTAGVGARELRLRTDAGEVRCRTVARLELRTVSREDLFAVPRVLRGGGCAPWLRGFVRLRGTTEPAGAALGLWLDLTALARSLS